jgi:CheY-like chemotaxis protein
MDINMPLINGFETTKLIAQRNDIPIVALTAFNKAEIKEALSAGINDIIIKPFDSLNYLKLSKY